MPLSALSNRTVVITGGFGVLAHAVATAALTASARVALIDRGPAPSNIDPALLTIANTDLASSEVTRRAFAKVEKEFGPIDALLNLAGAFRQFTVAENSCDLWLDLYYDNVLTAVNACRTALPLLQPGAAIVNIAAAAARRGAPGMAAYAAAKSGVLRLTESLAEELRPSGIRVYSVSPTIIDTPRNRKDMPEADTGTWVAPEAVARTILALVSDATVAKSGTDVLVGATP